MLTCIFYRWKMSCHNDSLFHSMTFIHQIVFKINRDSSTSTFRYRKYFPRVANPINKRVHSKSLFIGFASLEGNISWIWKSMWFNQYITFFFTKHFKFISICFEVLRGLCWSMRQWIHAKGYMKIDFLAAILFWNGQGYLLRTVE